MSDWADHWMQLIEKAIGYIAPSSENGKRLKPVLEQIRTEAQDMASKHMLQALRNGQTAISVGKHNVCLLAALRQCEFALRTLLPNDPDAKLSAEMARAAIQATGGEGNG